MGGYTSDLILQRLTQRSVAVNGPTHGRDSALPEHACPPVLVVLVDGYTSSDAEAVAQYLADAAGATIVGERPWGGVLSMDSSELVDGTRLYHPACNFRLLRRGGRSGGAAAAAEKVEIENHGVVPSVEVPRP